MLTSFLVTLALLLSYIWTTLPEVRPYTLQVAAALFLGYFILKRLSKSRLHHVMPQEEGLETVVLVAGITLLVGGTGGLTSPFLPLFHLLLFFAALTFSLSGSITLLVGLTLFLWATHTSDLSSQAWGELLSLPLLLPLLLFARWQFEEAQKERWERETAAQLLTEQETRVMLFFSTFLRPKLVYLRTLLTTSPDNLWAAQQQIQVIEQELNHVLREVDEASDTTDTTETP